MKRQRHSRKKEKSAGKNRRSAWPLVLLLAVTATWAGLAFVPVRMAVAGYVVLLVVGLVIAAVGGIGMAIRPFEESASCGLMYTYVPRYWLYYTLTRRKRMLRPFLWHVAGDVLAVAAVVALTARLSINAGRSSDQSPDLSPDQTSDIAVRVTHTAPGPVTPPQPVRTDRTVRTDGIIADSDDSRR